VRALFSPVVVRDATGPARLLSAHPPPGSPTRNRTGAQAQKKPRREAQRSTKQAPALPRAPDQAPSHTGARGELLTSATGGGRRGSPWHRLPR
jgi:hypothetical protein